VIGVSLIHHVVDFCGFDYLAEDMLSSKVVAGGNNRLSAASLSAAKLSYHIRYSVEHRDMDSPVVANRVVVKSVAKNLEVVEDWVTTQV